MFIDASALCAVLLKEPDRDVFQERILSHAGDKVTSPVALWETGRAIIREQDVGAQVALKDIERYLDAAGVRVVAVPPNAHSIALEAFDRFGKGRHPARLNMADCFAYACARHARVPLLYKGDDFVPTDIPSALVA